MISFFDRQDFNKFIKDLNVEIAGQKQSRHKFYAPDEDPEGNFHQLCSEITNVCKLNDELRERLGEYLLSQDFQELLYLNVGKFLGYQENEISRKSIKKKISDAVISSTFQEKRIYEFYRVPSLLEGYQVKPGTDSEPHDVNNIKKGNFKYLNIEESPFYHIFPSEYKKGQFYDWHCDSFEEIDALISNPDKKIHSLKSISKKITSNDLILDAEWYKLEERHKDTLIFHNENKFIKQEIKNRKNFWLYKFKNTNKNRRNLHAFFSKNNLKKEHWGDKKYIGFRGNDYLVTGDFIINIGNYFRKTNFPLHSDNGLKKIHNKYNVSGGVDCVNAAVNLAIQYAIGNLMVQYTKHNEKNFLNILSIIKNFDKPVCFNESILFIKAQLNYTRSSLISDAKSYFNKPNTEAFIRKMIFRRRGFERQYYSGSNPLFFEMAGKLQERVWSFFKQEKHIKSQVYGAVNKSEEQHRFELTNSLFAKNTLINSAINNIERVVEKQKDKNLKKINEWLEAEQLNFCQSYYENFEEHPYSKEGTNKAYKRIIKKYKEYPSKEIEYLFKEIYKDFFGLSVETNPKNKNIKTTYSGNEVPEKVREKIFNKYNVKINKTKESLLKKYEKLPDLPKTNRIRPKWFWGLEDNNIRLDADFALANGLAKSDINKKDFIKKCLIYEKSKLEKSTIFSGKNKNILKRYMTPSYANGGEEIKELFKELNNIKKQNSDRSINIIAKIRRWLIEEERNQLDFTYDKFEANERRTNNDYFFYYPDYKNASLKKFFQLKKIYKNIWDEEIINSISQVLSLNEMNKTFGADIYKEITKKIYKKPSIEKATWELVRQFIQIQDSIHFDKAYFGVSDSLFRVSCYLSGLFSYSISKDWAEYVAKSNHHEEAYMPKFDTKSQQIYVMDAGKENNLKPITIEKLNEIKRGYQYPMHSLVQNKEGVALAINKDISSLIETYGSVLDEIIDTSKKEIIKIANAGFYPLDSSLTYSIRTIIGTWEALNHFKTIKKYIDLIEKYDLYEIDSSINNNNKKREYILKKDANFLIRKSNTTHSKNNLDDLIDYLKEFKTPRIQNDIKYRQLQKIIKKYSIPVKKINGTDYLERKSFLSYLKNEMGYRSIKSLHFPTMDIGHLGFSSLIVKKDYS